VILRHIQDLRSKKEIITDSRMDDSCGSITTERFHGTDHTPISSLSPVNLRFTPGDSC
jgi:hypothetical protein